MNPVSENIFQAIDQLVDAKLNTIAFDKTDLCEVLLAYEDIPNTYRVSNGSMKFDAIGQPDTKYSKGQNVYVLIPKGDYTANKIIIGEYSAEEEKKYQYISPLDRLIVGWRGNWETNDPDEYLTISVTSGKGENPMSSEQKQIPFNESIPLNGFSKYTYMGFELGLGCSFEYLQGSYSIDVQLREEENTEPLYAFSILSAEIQGNPYSLSYQIPISHITDTSNIEDINKIKCVTFNLTQNDDFAEGDIGKTITLTSFHILFGYEKEKLLSEFNDGTLKVVLDTPFTPDHRQEDYVYDSNSEKILSLDWLFDKELYNEYLPFGSEQYIIYWCQYVKGYQKDLDNLDIEESGIYWKTIQRSSSANNEAYTLNFTPNSNWDEDQLKVVVCKEVNNTRQIVVTSEGITFKNKNLQAPQGTNIAVDNELELRLADNDDGNYNIYGTDNRLTSYTKKNITTSVTVHNYFDNTNWNDTEVVTWKIPINATMLKPDNNWKNEDDEYNITEDKQYYIVSGNNLRTITYDFADIYSSTRVHNTIYCEVYRADKQKTYRGSIDLRFGQTNTNGSGYSLNIIPSHYGGLENGKNIVYTATIEADDGTIIEQQPPIKWTWYYGNTNSEGQPYLKGFPLSDSEDIATLAQNQCQVARDDSIWQWDFNVVSRLILKAEVFNWQTNTHKVNLTAAYPIALGKETCYITGASRIMYDHTGHLSSYDTAPYSIFGLPSAAEVEDPTKVNTSEDEYIAVVWAPSGEQNIPQVETATNALKPLPQKPALAKPCHIQIKNKTKDFNAWYQPLLIEQDTYASALLNEWDGKLQVNGEKNYIMAQSIGAGIKNTDNTYTGVLMGKVMLHEGQSNETTGYGLYGFKNGELSFSFDENGDGYLKGDIVATNAKILNRFSMYNDKTPQRDDDGNLVYDENGKLIYISQEPEEFGWIGTDLFGAKETMFVRSRGSLYIRAWSEDNKVPGLINADCQMSVSRTGGHLFGHWTIREASSNVAYAVTSDLHQKNSIMTLSEQYNSLFDQLRPVTYRYNDGTSGRLHTGFIAQEVEQALMRSNISTQDFAGLVIQNRATEQELWTLRYEEFIALNTWQIQKLKARVTELETLLREKGAI